jgi:hypothetical protein
VISGETTIESANHASVRSLGANERRVRFPPLRPNYASVPRMGHDSANVVGRGSNPLAGTSRPFARRSQSVLGTAAAHSRVRDGSIPSTAT